MKYKYTRIQLSQAYGGYDHDEDFIEDLLAQKEDKKESLNEMEGRIVKIIKNWLKEDRKEIECVFQSSERLGGKQLKWKLKSPSPLEIEEIEEIDWVATIISKKKLARSINKLISNQKKLYQYIKEKKI